MRVFVGSTVWRDVSTGHMKYLIPLLRTPGFAYWPQVGDALVERARGISATHFLRETDYDVHLSIDSDITGFTVEDCKRICEEAMIRGIVCGSYVCRDANRTFPASFYEADVTVYHDRDHKPVEIKWGATGFMAVHRTVFESLARGLNLLHPLQPWAFYNFYAPFEYEDEDTGEPILLSEDYAFCERARRDGFKIWLDPAVRLGHIGDYTYRLEDTAQPVIPAQPLAITRTGGRRWEIESLTPEGVKGN